MINLIKCLRHVSDSGIHAVGSFLFRKLTLARRLNKAAEHSTPSFNQTVNAVLLLISYYKNSRQDLATWVSISTQDEDFSDKNGQQIMFNYF